MGNILFCYPFEVSGTLLITERFLHDKQIASRNFLTFYQICLIITITMTMIVTIAIAIAVAIAITLTITITINLTYLVKVTLNSKAEKLVALISRLNWNLEC